MPTRSACGWWRLITSADNKRASNSASWTSPTAAYFATDVAATRKPLQSLITVDKNQHLIVEFQVASEFAFNQSGNGFFHTTEIEDDRLTVVVNEELTVELTVETSVRMREKAAVDAVREYN